MVKNESRALLHKRRGPAYEDLPSHAGEYKNPELPDSEEPTSAVRIESETTCAVCPEIPCGAQF